MTYAAFTDELEKIAGFRDLWQGFLDLFRSKDQKLNKRIEYQFDPKAGPDKWNKFLKNVKNPDYAKKVMDHPMADEKLKLHTESMHSLAKGDVVNKIKSSRLPGRTYEIRKISGGNLGCMCPDWRFKGSVNPGYECKHIQAHKQGKLKADD